MEPPGKGAEPVRKGPLRELAETVAVALLAALLVRTFGVQLYRVDGESMLPTLHHGDRLLVNKLVYRLRAPAPGEVVVLQDPGGTGRHLVKRVIAVAGEEIRVRDDEVLVDGRRLAESYTNPESPGTYDAGPLVVPEGYVFVMGDNRGASLDSRLFGPVPVEQVEGRAVALVWPPGRFGGHGPLAAAREYE
ncbi:MAG: signal peptidase I [Symbiobacterium sp.]|uniref:signal peptidase I n=1 Tax=Symbiobacterium sp. TaxID=1971213 RepID=UPI003464274B